VRASETDCSSQLFSMTTVSSTRHQPSSLASSTVEEISSSSLIIPSCDSPTKPAELIDLSDDSMSATSAALEDDGHELYTPPQHFFHKQGRRTHYDWTLMEDSSSVEVSYDTPTSWSKGQHNRHVVVTDITPSSDNSKGNTRFPSPPSVSIATTTVPVEHPIKSPPTSPTSTTAIPTNRRSNHRGRRSSIAERRSILAQEKQERINALWDLSSSATRKGNDITDTGTNHWVTILCTIYQTQIARRFSIVILSSLLLRKGWILFGIPLLLIVYMVQIISKWVWFVAEAKEIRDFKGLAQWWIRFGLDFSSKTVEGESKIHRIITAYSLNFWNMVGRNVVVNIFTEISKEHEMRVIKEARDSILINTARLNKVGTTTGNIARQAINAGRNQLTPKVGSSRT
jgi:hypothetical protein